MSNSLGKLLSITSFGDSHGSCVGVVIDGCPVGLPLTTADIQKEVDKRKPNPDAGQTARAEQDKVEILSGIFEGHTTGAPVGMLVWNQDVDSSQYEQMKSVPRPGHADYTALMKYGGFNDYRGGGRFSGRVTVGLVMAGAVAKKLLNRVGLEVLAHTVQIGEVKVKGVSVEEIRKNVYLNPVRCAKPATAKEMSELIGVYEKQGDSIGGLIEGLALNVPVGIGEPYFDTLEGELAKALFAIPAVKGVEFGAGFNVANMRGSENNDTYELGDRKQIVFTTNNAGGILGGISNGMPLVVKVAVKPTPSISQKQSTVDLKTMENAEISIKGRHDVCIVPRAVIVVESMIAVTLCDLALRAGILPRIIK
jgi:chorismate synthase